MTSSPRRGTSRGCRASALGERCGVRRLASALCVCGWRASCCVRGVSRLVVCRGPTTGPSSPAAPSPYRVTAGASCSAKPNPAAAVHSVACLRHRHAAEACRLAQAGASVASDRPPVASGRPQAASSSAPPRVCAPSVGCACSPSSMAAPRRQRHPRGPIENGKLFFTHDSHYAPWLCPHRSVSTTLHFRD